MLDTKPSTASPDASMPEKQLESFLLTGVTGFLGKVVLEELLRRAEKPQSIEIYILIRANDEKTIEERFQKEIASSLCFSRLHPEWTSRVRLIQGNTELPGCGIELSTYKQLTRQITHIIHCAGCVKFNLPLATATSANVTSSLNILALAKDCQRLQHLVCVSTAYVTPHRSGPITENLSPLPLDAKKLYEDICAGRIDETELLSITQHANTYTLSKCIAEHLLFNQCRDSVPLTIVRPSIIAGSWQYPFPGWVDSFAAMAGVVAAIGSGLLHVLDCDPDTVIDVVPVDHVAARLIDEACWVGGVGQGLKGPRIVHCVSTIQNGICIRDAMAGIVDYFKENGTLRRPSIRYAGPRGYAFSYHETLSHSVPMMAERLLAVIQNDKRRRHKAKQYKGILEDLNNVFSYFCHHTFDFQSSIPTVGPDFEAGKYLQRICYGVQKYLLQKDPSQVLFGGTRFKPQTNSIQWALSKPNTNNLTRIAAILLRKAFSRMFDTVTFDQHSFEMALETVSENDYIVLVPTHRSYVDFLICSFLLFSRPDLGLQIPYIAASHEFSEIPLLGQLLPKLKAFYVRRGRRGVIDADLGLQVNGVLGRHGSILFFPEGQRSRSRMVLAPRRGILRALQATGKRFSVVPLSISYDRIAEEASFSRELEGATKRKMRLRDLAAWTVKMLLGKVRLGRVHIRCGNVLPLNEDTEVPVLAQDIAAELQANVITTAFHIQTFVNQHAGYGELEATWLRREIESRGGIVLDTSASFIIRFASNMDPRVVLGFQNHWIHLFYDEALLYQPFNRALQHFVDKTSFANPSPQPVSTSALDPRLQILLDVLFQPVCTEYARVSSVAKTWLMLKRPMTRLDMEEGSLDRTLIELAVDFLLENSIIAHSMGDAADYVVVGSVTEIQSLIDDCMWHRSGSLEEMERKRSSLDS